MKYKVEVGSFVTKFKERHITVHAKDETEAREKAIEKFWDMEMEAGSNDAGSPQIDKIEQL